MFLQQVVNGIMLGSTYSLVAIGYTLIFGVLGLLHFAHGEVFMLGAYFGLQIVLGLKAGLPGAIVGAMIGTAVMGFLIERVAFRPIKKSIFLRRSSQPSGLPSSSRRRPPRFLGASRSVSQRQ